MRVELCRKSLLRLVSDVAPAVDAVRERGHTPVVKDCLNRCQRCDLGFVMATADGTPLSVSTLEQLLAELDALAADDL
jgi:hypothetical protein